MTFAKELIQSANEALAIAEGRAVFVPETIDVAATRKNQNLSQKKLPER